MNLKFLFRIGFIFILFSIITIEKSFSATYYIAMNGSDNQDGSINSPWATLTKAHRVISAGDTIYIRGGKYTKQSTVIWTKSGTQSNPIIIQSYPGEKAIFDGRAFSGHLFLIKEADWIVIDGLEAHDYRCCVWMGYGGSGSNFAENNIIRNNYFHDTKEHIIYLSWGIKNVGVYNNRLENPSDELETNGYCIHGWHGPGVSEAKIFNNLIIGGYGGIVFADGAKNIEIYNNVLFDNYIGLRFDFYGEGDGTDGYVQNVIVQNNIIYSTNENLWGTWVATENANEINFDYNIWYRPDGKASIKWGDKIYNLERFKNETPNGSNSIEMDPQFLDISKRDFHLQSTSIAIDNGSQILAVATDKDNVIRPQGSGYDIGIYEFVKESRNQSDLTSPTPPTGIRVIGQYFQIFY